MAGPAKGWVQAHLPPRWGRVLAFCLALLGAPLILAGLGALLPDAAFFTLWAELLPYLVLAGPGFALALIWLRPRVLSFALIGLALNTLSPLVILGMARWLEVSPDREATRMVWSYGAAISALWGGCFALFYRWLRWVLVAS